MIAIKQIEDKNIFEFKVDDTIEKKDVKKLISFLSSKGEVNEPIKMLAEIESLAAFNNVRNVAKKLVTKVEAVQVISAYALLSDDEWIEDVVPLGDFFTPGLKIKQFAISEREPAIQWLKQC